MPLTCYAAPHIRQNLPLTTGRVSSTSFCTHPSFRLRKARQEHPSPAAAPALMAVRDSGSCHFDSPRPDNRCNPTRELTMCLERSRAISRSAWHTRSSNSFQRYPVLLDSVWTARPYVRYQSYQPPRVLQSRVGPQLFISDPAQRSCLPCLRRSFMQLITAMLIYSARTQRKD